jgi:DNA-binding NtrC family response regulator
MVNKKILICDDDEDILDMLGLILEDTGYEIITEQNSSNLKHLIESRSPDHLRPLDARFIRRSRIKKLAQKSTN